MCRLRVASFLGRVAVSQTLAVPSQLAVASNVPSGDHATQVTWLMCPLRASRSGPLAASQNFAVPSMLPVASNFPSGDQATA